VGKETGVNPYAVGEVYTDHGTGAYPNPPAEVVYGTEHDPEPTGLVEGPPAEVTTESPPEHLSDPTGAHPNPPSSVTYSQHPAPEPQTKAKAVKASEVEDKAVKPSTKRKGG